MQFDQATLDDQIANRKGSIRQIEAQYDQATTEIRRFQRRIDHDSLTPDEAREATEIIGRLQRNLKSIEADKAMLQLDITELEDKKRLANRAQPVGQPANRATRRATERVNGKVKEGVPA